MEGTGNVIEVQPGSSQSTSRQLSTSQPSYSRPSTNQASHSLPSTSQQIPAKNSPKKYKAREFYRQNNQNTSPSLNSPNSPILQNEAVPSSSSIQNIASKSSNTNIPPNTPNEEQTIKSQKTMPAAIGAYSPRPNSNGAIPKLGNKKYHERFLGRNARMNNPEDGELNQQGQFSRNQRKYDIDEFALRKVVVVGFPAYSRMEDIEAALSPFGSPEVLLSRNRVAVVQFGSEGEALVAQKATDSVKIYGELVSIYKYHHHKHVQDLINSNRRIMNDNKGPDIKAPNEIDLSGDFYAQLKNIEDAIRLTQEEVSRIGTLFADIEAVLKPAWPSCRAVPFGSITTGLGIKTSDADCFLELSPGRGAGAHSAHFVRKAAAMLRAQPQLFAALVPIPRANTPIIKFLHVPTNINCDLNSKTPLGAQNSRLMRHLLGSDARLGPLALLLKYWARAHRLSGCGRLTNYALLLLLLFYLQQRSLLPPVHSLQGGAHSFLVEGWEAGFDPSPLAAAGGAEGAAPLRDLLGGFFLFYARFAFDELVACPLLGVPVRKSLFEMNSLPPELSRYQQNVSARVVCPIRTNCDMCVQDPFELSHNVASGVSARLAAELKAHFTLAAAAFTRGETRPGDFLRGALLDKPAAVESADARTALRVSLSPELLARLGERWRDAAREVVVDNVFQTMLQVELTRRAAVSREKDVELEVYCGRCCHAVWARGKHSNARLGSAHELLSRHARISRRLPAAPDLHLPIEVELGFRTSSRHVTVTTSAMDGADQDAFRAFRQFLHAFVHRWFRTFLQPHLPAPMEPGLTNGTRKQKLKPSQTDPDKQTHSDSKSELKPQSNVAKSEIQTLVQSNVLRKSEIQTQVLSNVPTKSEIETLVQSNVPTKSEIPTPSVQSKSPTRSEIQTPVQSNLTECKGTAETMQKSSETEEKKLAAPITEIAPPVIDFINSFIKQTDVHKVNDKSESDDLSKITDGTHQGELQLKMDESRGFAESRQTCLNELVAGVSLEEHVAPFDTTRTSSPPEAT